MDSDRPFFLWAIGLDSGAWPPNLFLWAGLFSNLHLNSMAFPVAVAAVPFFLMVTGFLSIGFECVWSHLFLFSWIWVD